MFDTKNNFIKRVAPLERLLILIIICLCLIIAKSIYLILFITTLTLILLLITDKNIKIYVKSLKKVIPLLLIYLIIYIIVLRKYNILFNLVLLYKILLILILVKIYLLNTSFNEIHYGIYKIINPLKRIHIDTYKISLDFVLSLYFIKCFMDSFESISDSQKLSGVRKYNIKNYVFPVIVCSINKMNQRIENLKISFYNINEKTSNIKSKILLILFIILFIVCMFKEVI